MRAARQGICAACTFAAAVVSARGSTFLRCRHPRVPKYPPQPLRRCDGFDARGLATSDAASDPASDPASDVATHEESPDSGPESS